jgi:uncharacterized protein (TIGR03118 family)
MSAIKIKALLKKASAFILMELGAIGMLLNVSTIAIAQQYVRIDLTSDIPFHAVATDSKLVNAWGLAAGPAGPWWVAVNGTGVSTLYTGEGSPMPAFNPLAINIPMPGGVTMGTPAPTGIVYNGSSDFAIEPDRPAQYIFVTEDGTISGWSPDVAGYSHNAVLMVDNSSDSVYTGAAIARRGGESFLYVANFRSGTVDVFDSSFHDIILSHGAFTDPDIPDNFAPFNVQNINGDLYVAFAQRDIGSYYMITGTGLGYVDVFDPRGDLLMRLQPGSWMNAPWGVALAPDDFGAYSNQLLVGNSGSGTIAVFDPGTGEFKGLLKDARGGRILIEGLKGLGFGNGNIAGPANTLYFTGGIYGRHGLFGAITSGEASKEMAPTPIYPGAGY